MVVDTNVVLGDLLWLAGKRSATSARTALQEVIDSGTVIAFAPEGLHAEVEEHLPRLAQDKQIPEVQPPHRVPLETVAYAICRAAGTPLILEEIASRVRASGYTSRSEQFIADLRRVVRHSARLVRGADGRWSAATPEHTGM